MIEEAKEDDNASQGVEQQQNACMQRPPHPMAIREKGMGRRPLSRPETQSNSAMSQGRWSWR